MNQVSSNDTFDREVYKTQKREKKDRIFEMLSEETQKLLDPEKLKAYADVQARFLRSSVSNALLIWRQRKNSVVLQDVFVSATPEWIRALPEHEQQAYLEYAFDFFKERFGEDNIISAVVHLDEATPHMHLTFVPITKEGRLSSKELIGGPKGLVKMQDDFYAHMVERYPDLSQGISKTVTHRKHLPSNLYKNARELDKKYDAIVAAVNDIGIVGNAKKRDEAIKLLGQYAPEMAMMEGQLRTTEKYIKNLEQRVDHDDQVIAGKNSELNEKDMELFKERSKVRALEAQQIKLQKVINQIPREVLEQMATEERNRRKMER